MGNRKYKVMIAQKNCLYSQQVMTLSVFSIGDMTYI